MRDIRGHRAWNAEEIITILRERQSFTMCSLPHSRFNRVKTICRDLEKRGLIRRAGKTEVSVNFVPTILFKQWASEFASGTTGLWPIKWSKEQKRLSAEAA